ncbi:hypothetical protein DFJ74DRAFT_644676 [Hyaloraphidium curvatum]|nr:hypothetical protein DFJ74DRAFT_644676 [Hyaloraphidium curvatum]
MLRRLSIENVPPESWQSIVQLVFTVLFQIFALVNVKFFYSESVNTRVQKVRRDLAVCEGVDCGCVRPTDVPGPLGTNTEERTGAGLPSGSTAGSAGSPAPSLHSVTVAGASSSSSAEGDHESADTAPAVPPTTAEPGSANDSSMSTVTLPTPMVVTLPPSMPLSPTSPTPHDAHAAHGTQAASHCPHTPVVPIELRSVMLLNLPVNLRHPYALRRFFEHTCRFGAGEVEAVSVVGLHEQLQQELTDRWNALRDVEIAWVKWRGNDGERRYESEDAETRVDEVAAMLDRMRKELEADRVPAAVVTASTQGAVELGPIPALPPRPLAKPSLWLRIKAFFSPSSVMASQLQPFDALSAAWARFRFHNRRVHLLRREALDCAKLAFNGECDGPAGAFTPESPSATSPAAERMASASGMTKSEKARELYTGSTAFVTFRHARSAVVAAQTILPPCPGSGHASFMVLPAPAPKDLYWPNLSSKWASPKANFIRALLCISVLVLLVFFWSIPIGMIASLLSVESLSQTFPGFAEMAAELPPYVIDTFQAFVPSILVGIWLGLLPGVVLLLNYLQGIQVFSWIDGSTFSKLYVYYTWNLVLVFPISGSVWYALNIAVNSPNQVPYLLGSTLPGVAPFFINYINLLGFIFWPVMILLPGPMWGPALLRCCFGYRKKSPRAVASLAYPVDWMTLFLGQYTPLPMLVFTVTLLYSQIQPLVCLAGCTYFFLAFVAFKYLLMYEHVPFSDNRATGYGTVGYGGAFMRRVIFSVILQALTMWGVLTYKGLVDPATIIGVIEIVVAIIVWISLDSTLGNWEAQVGLAAAVEHEVPDREEEETSSLVAKPFYEETEVLRQKSLAGRSLTTVEEAPTVFGRKSTVRSATVAVPRASISVTGADVDDLDGNAAPKRQGTVTGGAFLEPGYVRPDEADPAGAARARRPSKFLHAAYQLASTVVTGGATDGFVPESALEWTVGQDGGEEADADGAGKPPGTVKRAPRGSTVKTLDTNKDVGKAAAQVAVVPESSTNAGAPAKAVTGGSADNSIVPTTAGFEADEEANDEEGYTLADPTVNGIDFSQETSYRFDTYDPESGSKKPWLRFTNYLEPPATRVAGILNPVIPLRGQSLFASREPTADDASLSSYEHPAIVGRLPWIWLPGVEDVLRVDADEGDVTNRAGAVRVENSRAEQAEEEAGKVQEDEVRRVAIIDEDDELVRRVQAQTDQRRQEELEKERELAARPWWLWGSTAEVPPAWKSLQEDVDHFFNAVGFWGSWYAR